MGYNIPINPKTVATPLPPFSPENNGYTWPKTAYIPIKRISILVNLKLNKLNNNGKQIPLIMSNINTKTPISVPSTLNVFVAPVPLLP